MIFLFLGVLFQCRKGNQGSRGLQEPSETTSGIREKRRWSNMDGQQQTHWAGKN